MVRTWLRVLLGELFKQHFNLKNEELIEINRLANENNIVPRIYFSHDDNPHKKAPAELNRDKGFYKKQKIIFLVRDPRDVLVSIFHHKKYRSEDFSGNIKDYLNQKIGGLESIIEFFNIWYDSNENNPNFLIISYENLHNNPSVEIKKILSFLEVSDVSESSISNAIKFASFKNMRKIELSGKANNDKLTTKKTQNETGYKTRSGKVGDYKQYFNKQELIEIENLISEKLSENYQLYK